MIEVKNLIKKYNDFTAVNSISFSVVKGECLGILGPNGAGKTTTVRIIQCISPSTSGIVKVFDEEASVNKRNIRARLGVVPQENDLDTDLTVLQNITLFARLFDIPKKEADSKAKNLLQLFELSQKKDQPIEQLSGGMKRRLLLARSLINEPKLMILDEPTTGLDPQARHLIWQRLRNLKANGITILLNTQYMDEAAQLCDRILILDKGKILKEGTPKNLVIENVGQEVIEVRNNDRIRRPATLEDLFLKLTGRGLTE